MARKTKKTAHVMHKTATLMMIVLLFSVVMAGCGSKQDSAPMLDANFRKGTDGLRMAFIENMPTSALYAGEKFNIGLNLENVGANDIVSGRITLSGYERNQYTFTGETGNTKEFQLRGRSQYDQVGEKIPLVFDVKSNCYPAMAEQLRTNLTTTFRATACYIYSTIANAQICIDTNPLATQGAQKKVCQVRPVTLSGGQGGPVAVTMVEPSMLPSENGVRARFLIHIKNVNNNGIVYSISAFDANCEDTQQTEFQNKITFGAALAGIPMYCTPGGELELMTGADTIISCEVDLTKEGGVYETQMSVQLDYAYSQDAIKKVNVNKPLNVDIPDCRDLKPATG